MSDRRTFAGRFPRTFRVFMWLYFLMFTIALAALIPASVKDLSTLATPGQVGTVVVTRCNNAAYPDCYGDFSSADGSVSITDAKISGAGYDHVGDRSTAYGDPVGKTISIPRNGGDIAIDIVGPLLLLLVWVPAFLYCIYLPVRRRLRRRQRAVSQR